MVRRFLVSIGLAVTCVASVVGPAFADAPMVQCAVGYVAGPQHVVMTLGEYNSAASTRLAGETCTGWIASGDWTGANKFTDWTSVGYQFLCQASFGSNGTSVDVFSYPYYSDRVVGYQTCQAAANVGGRVVYGDVGPAWDFR